QALRDDTLIPWPERGQCQGEKAIYEHEPVSCPRGEVPALQNILADAPLLRPGELEWHLGQWSEAGELPVFIARGGKAQLGKALHRRLADLMETGGLPAFAYFFLKSNEIREVNVFIFQQLNHVAVFLPR